MAWMQGFVINYQKKINHQLVRLVDKCREYICKKSKYSVSWKSIPVEFLDSSVSEKLERIYQKWELQLPIYIGQQCFKRFFDDFSWYHEIKKPLQLLSCWLIAVEIVTKKKSSTGELLVPYFRLEYSILLQSSKADCKPVPLEAKRGARR